MGLRDGLSNTLSEAGINRQQKQRALWTAIIVLGVIVLMVAFDIGILWMVSYSIREVWAGMVWVVESIYWLVSSLFEVKD